MTGLVSLCQPLALKLHYVICCNRSLQFRQLCSDWRRWVVSSSFSALKRECAQFAVLDCHLFSNFWRCRHPCTPMDAQFTGPVWREQTPQGSRGFLPCVSLLADVAAGSERARAARAPVAAGSQKSFSSIINASSLLAWFMDIFSKWHRTNLSPAINGTHNYKKIWICSV